MAKRIGIVTHYYPRINVAVIKLENNIKAGDWITISGYTTEFIQRIDSMQKEHHTILEAAQGEIIAIEVVDRVRAGDEVFQAES